MTEHTPLIEDRVIRLGPDEIELRIGERERAILAELFEELAAVLDAPPRPELPWLDEVADADAGASDPADAREADDDADEDEDEDDPDRQPDPVQVRLYPTAVTGDAVADAAYRGLVHEEMEAGRRERLATVAATVTATTLDDEEAESWMLVLNDARLVLGTRLDITAESDVLPSDPDDPTAMARIVFAYTGWLEGQFIDVLAASLPPVKDPWPPVDSPDADPPVDVTPQDPPPPEA